MPLDVIFVTGSANPAHSQTEVYTLSENTWTVKAEYPFAEAVACAPVISHNDQFIVFGGWGLFGTKRDRFFFSFSFSLSYLISLYYDLVQLFGNPEIVILLQLIQQKVMVLLGISGNKLEL